MSLDFVLNKFRLIGIFGLAGSAKTSMCTFLASVLQDVLGLPIASNYDIYLPNARRYEIDEMVSNEFTDTIIPCDEIISNADSRLSLTMQNIYYSYFISQIRKSPKKRDDGQRGFGNFCIYTAQLQSMADIRVFEQTRLYIMMEQLPSGDFSMEWFNQEGESGQNDIFYDFLKEVAFPFYNTDEKVMPLAIKSMQVEMEKFNPVKRNARLDAAVKLVLDLKGDTWRDWKDVKQFTVKDVLEREGLPERLGVPVFNRVCEEVRLRGLKR